MTAQQTLARTLCLLLLITAPAAGPAAAQQPAGIEPAAPLTAAGAAFTYQGQLNDVGNPANGIYDFEFRLYDALSNGSQIGSTAILGDVSVSDGVFTVELDFGASAFAGDARWLEIQVRAGASSGSYTLLSPRQALTATPYALSLRPGAVIAGEVGDATLAVNHTATSGSTYGVSGESASPNGVGVHGYNSATSGFTYGVYGESASPKGSGVRGYASSLSDNAYGVSGVSASTSGRGVFGWAQATSGTTYGIVGQSDSTGGRGVYGLALGSTGSAYGVYGLSSSTSGRGVYGMASATSGSTYGVYGENASTTGTAVFGRATAASGNTVGVFGMSDSTSGYAGFFNGRVHVVGDLSAGGAKPFKIDHPLDPANRYLYHFSQEAPEVQNVYNGVVTLDGDGRAVVVLPEYFAALNTGSFRYQLTAMGAPMPNLYIAREIQDSRFQIDGGAPGQKVSWEVTAVRNDPYLRDHAPRVEVDKPVEEQGTYLYPQGYGQPAETGLEYQRGNQYDHSEGDAPKATD